MGIVWDGIGFGSETEIFGGEFFTYQNNKINRIAHLDYFSWILGDKMSKNPKISALSISENDLYFQKYFTSSSLGELSFLMLRVSSSSIQQCYP